MGNLGPSLPDVFGGKLAGSLAELNLAGNAINTLPPSLAGLRCLVQLDLSRNELREIPESLGALSKLQFLEASNNSLKGVPAALFQRTSLVDLMLRGNPIDRLKLQETPGFTAFLERRKSRIDAKIDSHVVGTIDLAVCGLD
eukprot:NODE_6035_length_534_cov_169.916493.p1 GENE.NODE_6035_length_534_cov_169.916493~~NODE_6035_length_534_cov_169.916493.p1  ORF type:complete len:142 (+),score=44.32 NODE_6035_length_534_cov_169.916493:3-428(+)